MKTKKRKVEAKNNNKKTSAHPRESADNFQNGKICHTPVSFPTEQRNMIATETFCCDDAVISLKGNNYNNLISDTGGVKIKNIDISMSYVSLDDIQKTNKQRFNSHKMRSKLRKYKTHITIAESFAKERTEACQKYEIKINYENTECSTIPDSRRSDTTTMSRTKLIEPLPQKRMKPIKRRYKRKKVRNCKNTTNTTKSQDARLGSEWCGVNEFIDSNEPPQINVSCDKSNEIIGEEELFGNLSFDTSNENFGVLNVPDSTVNDTNICENVSPVKFCNRGISDEELKQRLKDRLKKQKGKTTVDILEESSSDSVVTNSQGNKANDSQVTSSLKSTSLQDVLYKFMNDPQLKNVDTNILKRGICFTWMSNNFTCKKLSCHYCHNAFELFKKKLKCYSSKFIMSFTALMQNDVLFVDSIMAVFKVLSERENPEIWISFLIFFVFYVTEPSDVRLIKFWSNSARFFCQLGNDYSAANGFASLLSIFNDVDVFQKKKIVEFINVIKQPPTQICITWDLLEPVLKMDLPLQYLIEALKSCVEKQKYSEVLKVDETLIPKIMEATLTLEQFELLIQFCQVLKSLNENDRANSLKQRISDKIDSIKLKASENGYFNTVQLKKKLGGSLIRVKDFASEDCFENYFQEKASQNYLKLGENYYTTLAKAMQSDAFLSDPKKRSVFSETENFEYLEKQEAFCANQTNTIRAYINSRLFDLLAKHLNDIKGDNEKVAEEIVRELFQKRISVEETVELVKSLLLSCGSEDAALITASVGVTVIFHLVKVGEWDKAHTVLFLCNAKQLNLINGSVFSFNGSVEISQSRKALLLAEVYAYKENYKNALHLIKIHFLFSPNPLVYNLSWKEDDEKIRIRILEELLEKLTHHHLTNMAHDLFYLIWKEQNQLESPLDLRKFANEVLTLLINEENEDAIHIYHEIKSEMELRSCIVRAILVTLVRRNELEKAKSIPLSLNQSVYFLPDVTSSAAVIVVSSFWLEEEIFIMFDTLFDLLRERKYNADEFSFGNCDDYGVRIQISYSEQSSFSCVAPLCLSLLNSSFPTIYGRIQWVLQNQFQPPVQLSILSKALKLEKYSLKRHLDHRAVSN